MSKEQTITINSGGYRLIGTLHLPEGLAAPMVVGCHGLLANRHSPKQIALARTCCDHGIGYLRFDFHGCGDSTGDFARGTALEVRCGDLSSAVTTLMDHPQCGPLLGLFGSSFGGTVVLAYAAVHPVPSLVTYAAPITSQGLGATRVGVQLDPELSSTLAHNWQFDIGHSLSAVGNILIIHAQGDAVVPVSHAHEIHIRARDPKKIWIQDQGDHPMSDPQHQTRFLSQALDWYQRGHEEFSGKED